MAVRPAARQPPDGEEVGHVRDQAALRRRLIRHLFPYRYAEVGDPEQAKTVARHLYGAILVLGVLLSARDHASRPLVIAVVLAVTVLVLLGMEAYAEVVAQEIMLRRPLTGDERVAAVRQLFALVAAAEIPLLFLLLAGTGVVSLRVGFRLAEAATLSLLFYYGYLARRLAGRPTHQAVRSGLGVLAIGLALAVGKGFVHF